MPVLTVEKSAYYVVVTYYIHITKKIGEKNLPNRQVDIFTCQQSDVKQNFIPDKIASCFKNTAYPLPYPSTMIHRASIELFPPLLQPTEASKRDSRMWHALDKLHKMKTTKLYFYITYYTTRSSTTHIYADYAKR